MAIITNCLTLLHKTSILNILLTLLYGSIAILFIVGLRCSCSRKILVILRLAILLLIVLYLPSTPTPSLSTTTYTQRQQNPLHHTTARPTINLLAPAISHCGSSTTWAVSGLTLDPLQSLLHLARISLGMDFIVCRAGLAFVPWKLMGETGSESAFLAQHSRFCITVCVNLAGTTIDVES